MNAKLTFAALALMAATPFAARMTITSYGIPHTYTLNPTDEITFDPSGLMATIRTPAEPAIVRKVYLGYSNKVTLDGVGGTFANIYINGADKTQQAIDFSTIDSLVFTPSIDETGDDDSDKLSTFSELMIHYTDPKKTDTDGDGLSDEWEALRDQRVYSPLISNLPQVSISMNKRPQIYLITNKTTTKSQEYTVTEGSSWETSESSTTSDASSFTNENSVGVSITVGAEATAGLLGGFRSSFEVTASYDHTWGSSTTHEVSSSHQVTSQTNLEHAKSYASESGEEITGGKLSVSVKMTNTGTIGVSLGEPTFALYGVLNGKAEHLKDLTPASALSKQELPAGVAGIDVELTTKTDLTLAEVEKMASYGMYKVVMTNPSMTYKPDIGASGDLSLTNVLTGVNAATARVTVDFNDCLPGQESPFSRNVATLTKFNPTAGSTAEMYGPVYLGELLTHMGLTYEYDEFGFKAINGFSRDANNLWSTQVIHPRGLGGQKADTAYLMLGNPGGPDSVVIKTGDRVTLSYSGDDDRDSVSNAVAKLFDIYVTASNQPVAAHDFDGDGISNHDEIFGWKPAGSAVEVHTDPRVADTDLDGLNDAVDPEPTVRKKASHADLQSFKLLNDGAEIATLAAPYAASNAIAAAIPARPKLVAAVDSVALWVKFVVNGDSLEATYDSSNANGHWYSYEYSWNTASMIALGATDIDVVTLSEDLANQVAWKFFGTSKMYNGLNSATLTPLLDSNVIAVQPVNVSYHKQLEPRTSGFMLFRSASPTATLNIASRTTVVQLGEVVAGNWTFVGKFTDVDQKDYVDQYQTAEGTEYSYALVAYAVDGNSAYSYAPASPVSKASTLYRPRWLVTQVGILFNSEPVTAGSTKINVDLNSNAGGAYVYVEFKRELVKFSESRQIVTDLTLDYNGGSITAAKAAGYTLIDKDLNLSTSTHEVTPRLMYKTGASNVAANFSRGISKLNAIVNAAVPNTNWYYVNWYNTTTPADCNAGARGDTPLIIYTRSQSE